MANPSLAEYLAQSQRGMYQSVFGPDYLQKGVFTVDTDTNIFDTTYGRKVWQALNNQTRFFNAIPRVVWGNTAGWRVRSDRGAQRSRPVTEVGSLPSVDVSQIETISSLPRIVSTTFGASVKSVFTAQMEGGIGDVLAMENEHAQLDHIKEINEEILAGSAYRINGSHSTSAAAFGAASIRNNFKIGDVVDLYDVDGNVWTNHGFPVVSYVGNTISIDNTGLAGSEVFGVTPANGDLAVVRSRAGFTSIDDVVMQDNVGVGGVSTAGNQFASGGVRAYDLTFGGRDLGLWNAAATVLSNDGVGRDLSLNLLDTCIQKVRENGGEPKLILMGHDQYFKLERLLNSQQRYMGQEEYQVGIGSERTFPGTRTGLVLATYMGIPIMPDADVPKSVASNGTTVLGSNIYVLDTDYIEMAIAQPTQYVENRDYFAANQLIVRGLLYTMGEMRCKNIWVQAKITDLNA